MMAGTVVRAAWRPALCLAAVLAFAPTAAQAQDTKADQEKARAEVRKLEAQLDVLHERMHETAAKLWKARARLAAESGAKEKWAGHHRHWGMFAHAGMHHHMWAAHHRHAWHEFAGHHAASWHAGAHAADLERKVNRLEHEVHEMLHMLRADRTGK